MTTQPVEGVTVVRPRTATVVVISAMYGALIVGACIIFISSALKHPDRVPLFVDIVFVGFFGFCAFSIAYMLSIWAVLGESCVTKASFLGAKSLPYARITSAIIGPGGRALSPPVLSVSTGRDHISFFGFGLSFEQLQEIQKAIVHRCAAQSIVVKTTRPPIPQKAVPALAMGYLFFIVVLFGFLIVQGIERQRHLHALQEQSISH